MDSAPSFCAEYQAAQHGVSEMAPLSYGAVNENCGVIQLATSKRCIPSEGSMGGNNYPEAEEREAEAGGVEEAAAAEAEDEDEADNGASVSVLAAAAAAR
jgi:hypothetical protein